MKQWHLIQFKPNSHRMAVLNLKRQGFETFLPLQEITRRKASRFAADLKPLFPGYMFVGVALGTAPWRKINSTFGVTRLVSFADNYKPLPQELICNLKLRCDEEGKLLPPKTLNAGDSVEVLHGPFANFVATVEKIDAQQRVWVLMEFMGQSTKMHLAPDNVQIAP
ncbi:MAG: transcriptional activator RfaH [Ascidiaceihabitans sp.]|nr:transcriptional activator RfaH [Ascidiaceihabitans sp.]